MNKVAASGVPAVAKELSDAICFEKVAATVLHLDGVITRVVDND